MTTTLPAPDLMKAFGFDDDELAANRAGRITENQKRWLEIDRRDVRQHTLGCVGGFVAVAAFYIGIGLMNNGRIPSPNRHIDGSASVESFVIVSAIAVVGVLGLLWVSGWWASRDWRKGVAAMTEGQIGLREISVAKGTYSLSINGKTFTIHKQAYDALTAIWATEGHRVVYRVYYAPGSWKVLSIEKLGG